MKLFKLLKIRKFIKKNHLKCNSFVATIKYLHLRLKYKIGIDAYLDNKLFDSSVDHTSFFETLHTYIHSWKYASKNFLKNSTKKEIAKNHKKYCLYKIVYPGLDAEDYFRYCFSSFPHKKRKTFITEGFQKKMVNHFNPETKANKKFLDTLSNKVLFNIYFSDYIQRKWVSSSIDKDALKQFCLSQDGIIAKPTNGGGGKGIIYIQNTKENFNVDEFVNTIKSSNCEYIIEEIVKQNSKMSAINPTSINTIRIYTLIKNNYIHIVCATLRVGNGESFVDNYSSGNYACSINLDSGTVDSSAVNQYGERLNYHPKTKTQFIGFQIPCWNECCEMVKKAHQSILNLRYIGWDVAINSKNTPLLIEANSCAGVELQQHPSLNGKKPIYKKYW